MIKRLFLVMEDALCAIVLIVMTALTFVSVIARYLFKSSMPFVEELTAVGLVILSLVGAAVAIKRGAHLGLSALTDLFPRIFHKWIALLGDLSGIGLSVVMIYFGYLMTKQQFMLKLSSPGMQWPLWMYGVWVPIGGLIMMLRFIQHAIFIINKRC